MSHAEPKHKMGIVISSTAFHDSVYLTVAVMKVSSYFGERHISVMRLDETENRRKLVFPIETFCAREAGSTLIAAEKHKEKFTHQKIKILGAVCSRMAVLILNFLEYSLNFRIAPCLKMQIRRVFCVA